MLNIRSVNHKTTQKFRLFFKYTYILPPLLISAFSLTNVYAEDETPERTEDTIKGTSNCPSRPKLDTNRWAEDWSVLQNSCVTKEPLDQLKYIPFADESFLSLGANLRERYEINHAPKFGTANTASENYLIQRLQIHADLRLGENTQLFTQLVDARAFDKKNVSTVDENPLDIEQLFLAWTFPTTHGNFKMRVGRQQMAFDLQRFISNREGPNVRQSFDGAWVDYEYKDWRLLGYATQPVQNKLEEDFDDHSNQHLQFSGFRFDRANVLSGDLSGYYSYYRKDQATYPSITGKEKRNLFDIRHIGSKDQLSWDIETMLQTGKIDYQDIQAWALSSIVGYSLKKTWQPKLNLQFDLATGDKNNKDHTLNTFNQLFANGSYFTLAGYSGYSNIVHLKPSLTLNPTDKLTLLTALGFQWRQTTQDAIYQQGNSSIAHTAGKGSKWTGAYAQLRADYKVNDHLALASEIVHFQVGDTLKQVNAKNSNYLGLELKYAW